MNLVGVRAAAAASARGSSRTTARSAATRRGRRSCARSRAREQIIEEVKASGLRGRGGAGFPDRHEVELHAAQRAGAEIRRLQFGRERARHLPRPRHPALQPALADRRHGDRRLRDGRDRRLQLHPRRVPRRAGAALRSGAEGSLRGRPARQEHPRLRRRLRPATPFVGAGAYICGEETALLDSLEGKQGKPRFKPPFPANFGLYGEPTTINNTQSYASVPTILRKGAKWFAELGVANSGGTVIFSVSGHVDKPRQLSSCRSAFRSRICWRSAGGVRDGRKLKAVIPGGSSVPVRAGRHDDDREHGLRLAARRRARRSAPAR